MRTVKLSALALALAGFVLAGCEQGGTGQTGSPAGGGGTTSGGGTTTPGQAPGGSGGGAQPGQSPQ